MPLLNKIFGKKNKKEKEIVKAEARKPTIAEQKTVATFAPIKSDILLASVNTEKAMLLQGMGRYTFKIASGANKIEISKAVGKTYNVKTVSVNIINVPKKARQVGKIKGFKAGYKKAVVTLAQGQSIELK